MPDTVDESTIRKIFADATENVAKQVVGNTIKAAKEKKEALIEQVKAQKAKLLASLNETPKDPAKNEG
jgi:hypothetical protein